MLEKKTFSQYQGRTARTKLGSRRGKKKSMKPSASKCVPKNQPWHDGYMCRRSQLVIESAATRTYSPPIGSTVKTIQDKAKRRHCAIEFPLNFLPRTKSNKSNKSNKVSAKRCSKLQNEQRVDTRPSPFASSGPKIDELQRGRNKNGGCERTPSPRPPPCAGVHTAAATWIRTISLQTFPAKTQHDFGATAVLPHACSLAHARRATHRLFHDRHLLLLGCVRLEHPVEGHPHPVRPEGLEVVVAPALGGHDVHDDVTVVQQDPPALRSPLHRRTAMLCMYREAEKRRERRGRRAVRWQSRDLSYNTPNQRKYSYLFEPQSRLFIV